ncbi:hypothetical protein [Actinomadura sp. 21ATH]|uniref:hypothetical protein n=1 Tax=Actinomadura sp. 21ATH TaxID=1735444 RepID=UPI0035C02DB0
MDTTVDKPPRPSASEQLIADYGHAWEIWRELLPEGRHGDWMARAITPGADGQHQQLRASTIPALRDLLEEVTKQP